jgi:hypothetical protein
MSDNAPTITANPPATARSYGRGYFWLAILVCVLGVALVFVQFGGLKRPGTPWYLPSLATLGVVLMVISIARRRSIPRIIGLVLIAGLAGFEWYFFGWLLKLDDYQGPAQAGSPMPSFSATFADGRSFTDANTRDGSRRVMSFFRGRW